MLTEQKSRKGKGGRSRKLPPSIIMSSSSSASPPSGSHTVAAYRAVFAARLREARINADLRQTDIADHLGVSRQAVSAWEAGDALPERPYMVKLAKLLRVDINWLTDGEGVRPTTKVPSSVTFAEIQPTIGAGEQILDMTPYAWWNLPHHVVADLRAPAQSLYWMRVEADVGEPAIRQGGYVLVDTTRTQPLEGRPFVIDTHYSSTIKVIRYDQKRPEMIGLQDVGDALLDDLVRRGLCKRDGPGQAPVFVSRKDMRIIGLVVKQFGDV